MKVKVKVQLGSWKAGLGPRATRSEGGRLTHYTTEAVRWACPEITVPVGRALNSNN